MRAAPSYRKAGGISEVGHAPHLHLVPGTIADVTFDDGRRHEDVTFDSLITNSPCSTFPPRLENRLMLAHELAGWNLPCAARSPSPCVGIPVLGLDTEDDSLDNGESVSSYCTGEGHTSDGHQYNFFGEGGVSRRVDPNIPPVHTSPTETKCEVPMNLEAVGRVYAFYQRADQIGNGRVSAEDVRWTLRHDEVSQEMFGLLPKNNVHIPQSFVERLIDVAQRQVRRLRSDLEYERDGASPSLFRAPKMPSSWMSYFAPREICRAAAKRAWSWVEKEMIGEVEAPILSTESEAKLQKIFAELRRLEAQTIHRTRSAGPPTFSFAQLASVLCRFLPGMERITDENVDTIAAGVASTKTNSNHRFQLATAMERLARDGILGISLTTHELPAPGRLTWPVTSAVEKHPVAVGGHLPQISEFPKIDEENNDNNTRGDATLLDAVGGVSADIEWRDEDEHEKLRWTLEVEKDRLTSRLHDYLELTPIDNVRTPDDSHFDPQEHLVARRYRTSMAPTQRLHPENPRVPWFESEGNRLVSNFSMKQREAHRQSLESEFSLFGDNVPLESGELERLAGFIPRGVSGESVAFRDLFREQSQHLPFFAS